MCTVTVIAFGAGVRVVSTRDESPRRAPARPPAWRESGGVRALWPTDPEGGGTWIGAAETGLCLAIMNLNPTPRPPVPPRDRLASRGLIIPDLLGRPSVAGVGAALAAMSLDRFAPFRLIAVQADEPGAVIAAAWDRRRLELTSHGPGPACFTSSGLGDAIVDRPRAELFRRLVVEPGATPQAQDEFHRHRWPDRPDISVRMWRPDARSVSICRVELTPAGTSASPGARNPALAGPARVEMVYEPLPDTDRPAGPDPVQPAPARASDAAPANSPPAVSVTGPVSPSRSTHSR